MPASPTYVVELTPPGRGAIAVVLVAGPDSVAAVGSLFSAANEKPLDAQPIGRIVFGRWNDAPKRRGEELIVCRRDGDRVEVHPHGGVASVTDVIDRLSAAGCTQIDWSDWVSHEEPDPIRAAARKALADAPTDRTAAILLDQYHGALRRTVDSLRWHFKTRAGEGEAFAERDALLARADIGRHLTRPWNVVLAGPPNVGKSSLINAVLGYTRAIVFDQPGTTRDVVTATTAIDGWPIEFSDTAGLSKGGDPIEVEGVELTKKQVAEADLIVWVDDAREYGTRNLDCGVPCLSGNGESVETGHNIGRRPLQVLNKIDLLQGDPEGLIAHAQSVRVADNHPDTLLTSATTSDGIPELLSAIATRLVPEPPPPGVGVPFTDGQIEMIRAM